MYKLTFLLCISIYLYPNASPLWAQNGSSDNKKINFSKCEFNGFKLYGKIKVVDAFPDLKVQVVDAFPDLKVKIVDAFPDECGKWKFVEAFPDTKIQFVTAFPDIKIQYVEAFPGKP